MSGSFLFYPFSAPIPSGQVSSTKGPCCRKETAYFAPLYPKSAPAIHCVPIIPSAFRPVLACIRSPSPKLRPSGVHPQDIPQSFGTRRDQFLAKNISPNIRHRIFPPLPIVAVCSLSASPTRTAPPTPLRPDIRTLPGHHPKVILRRSLQARSRARSNRKTSSACPC